MIEIAGDFKLRGAFGCGDAPPPVHGMPELRLINPVELPAGGVIADGEYVQTVRLVRTSLIPGAFSIAQSFGFRGRFVRFQWVEFTDKQDPGALLYDFVGTYTTEGSLLSIDYFNCTDPSAGSHQFRYSAFPTGLELISTTACDALSGRFTLQRALKHVA